MEGGSGRSEASPTAILKDTHSVEGLCSGVAPSYGQKHHALRWKGFVPARDQAGGEGEVTMPYSYNCREYPEMEECPGSFVAASEEAKRRS